MSRPLLSIIVPTRERADVLLAAVATLVGLKRQDVEFIICDNASTDATEATIRQFNDPRIRYIRSNTRITMPKNFELGLQHAQGEYVTTMGDDDFIIEENLELVLEVAGKEEVDLVYWYRSYFYWGSYQQAELAGTFSLPTGRNYYEVNSPTMLGLALTGVLPYYYMASIYNSLCRRSFLKRYFEHLRGQYFPDYVVSMDVFSALVFASLSPSSFYLESPVSVSGISHHSNGMSIYSGGRECEEFAKELGFNDGAVILPEEYRGIVRPITKHGVAELSVLTDYNNAVNRLLKFTCPLVPRSYCHANMLIRRLQLEGHVEVKVNSELHERIAQANSRGAVLRNDLVNYFFNLWSIPVPQNYSGRFADGGVNVWHLAAHLQSIGFNKAPAT